MQTKTLHELEAVNIRLDGINSIARAVEDAMIYSPNDAGEYAGAIGVIAGMIIECKDKMNAAIDQGFYEMHSEASE